MTFNQFASLSGTTFATVVKSRQALTAARKAVDLLEESCTCERRCRCDVRNQLLVAKNAERTALAENTERELAWIEYCNIRN